MRIANRKRPNHPLPTEPALHVRIGADVIGVIQRDKIKVGSRPKDNQSDQREGDTNHGRVRQGTGQEGNERTLLWLISHRNEDAGSDVRKYTIKPVCKAPTRKGLESFRSNLLLNALAHKCRSIIGLQVARTRSKTD